MKANEKTSQRPREVTDPESRGMSSGVQPVEHAARQRVGKLMKVGDSGRVWVEIEGVSGGRFSVECIATGPLSEQDLGSELVVWLHARGIGIVIGREPPPVGIRARLAKKLASLVRGEPRSPTRGPDET